MLRLIFSVSLILSLCACKTGNSATLKTATEFEQESIDLSAYIASSEVLRNYRKEFDKNIEPGASNFCERANRTRSGYAFRTKNLPFHKLKIEEMVALSSYSHESYYEINRSLRNESVNKRGELKYSILVTASALNSLPNFQGMVYRGLKLTPEIFAAYSEAAKTGKNFTEKAFVSTTLSPAMAIEYSSANNGGLLLISSKHGHIIENISAYPKEREVLFSPGSEFKVHSITTKTFEEMSAFKDDLEKKLTPFQVTPLSSDPMAELTECGEIIPPSEEEVAKFESSITDGPFVKSAGPIGEIPAMLRLDDKDWNKDIKGKYVVIEMEEVTPKL